MSFIGRLLGSERSNDRRPEERAFVENVVTACRERFPSCTFEADVARFAIVVRQEGLEAVLDLDVAWRREQQAQRALARGGPAREGGVAHALATLGAGIVPRGLERLALLERVLPAVLPAVAPDDPASTIVRCRLPAASLDYAFAAPLQDGVVWVDRRLVVATGVTPAELALAAQENLARRPLRADDVQVLAGPDARPFAILFTRREELASSWVFHPELAGFLAATFRRGFHLGVPERELLVAAPADGRALVAVAKLVRERFESAARPISPLLFPARAFQLAGAA